MTPHRLTPLLDTIAYTNIYNHQARAVRMISPNREKAIRYAIKAFLANGAPRRLEEIRKSLSKKRITFSQGLLEHFLKEMIRAGEVSRTSGGRYCLSEGLAYAEDWERRVLPMRSRGPKPLTKKALEQRPQPIIEHSALPAPHSYECLLRPTTRTGASSPGGTGNCHQCSRYSDQLESVRHTTWGTVQLCRECCLAVMRMPVIPPEPAPTRIIYVAMGNTRRR